MEIQTFAEFESKVEACHGTVRYTEPESSAPGKVVIAFTYNGGVLNAAHLRMSPSEARRFAELILVNANRLDPEGKHGK